MSKKKFGFCKPKGMLGEYRRFIDVVDDETGQAYDMRAIGVDLAVWDNRLQGYRRATEKEKEAFERVELSEEEFPLVEIEKEQQ